MFDDFSVEYHPNCNYDTLWVYEGADTTGKLYAKLCGRNIQIAPVSSWGNQMFLIFTSDATNNDRGFKLTYEFVELPGMWLMRDLLSTNFVSDTIFYAN